MTAERGPRQGYTFSETRQFVDGMIFAYPVIQRGIVVGNRLFIAGFGKEKDGSFQVGFARIADGQTVVMEQALEKEALQMFKRYEYRNFVLGRSVLLRVGRRQDYDGSNRKFLAFEVQARSRIERADKLGITIRPNDLIQRLE